MAVDTERQTDWHRHDVEAVLADLDAPSTGLSTADARQRLDRYGPNELQALARSSAWHTLAAQFKNLLVIILLELFRTVIRFLQTEVLDLEPYLAVGIIACTRRVLTASAELSHQLNITETQFYQYLMDVGLNVAVIMVLVVGVFLIRKRPVQPLAMSS